MTTQTIKKQINRTDRPIAFNNGPGVITSKPVSGVVKWEGQHSVAEELIKGIPGVKDVCVQKGTRGRPVDCITVTVDPEQHPHDKRKSLVKAIEVMLRNILGLIIDYRVVSIH